MVRSSARDAPAKSARGDAPAGDINGIAHAEAAKELRYLIGPAQAAANALLHRQRGDVFVEEAMRPAVGMKSPVMALNSVVLPAPFEPMMARRSLAATRKVMPAAPLGRRSAAPRCQLESVRSPTFADARHGHFGHLSLSDRAATGSSDCRGWPSRARGIRLQECPASG